MLWYPGDWLKDPAVSRCTPATRGVWMDLLCAMHESGRSGVLRGTPEEIARIARCSAPEAVQAIAEIHTSCVADVTYERDGHVTLINRRMKAEADKRLKDAHRQRKSRMSHAMSRDGPNDVALEYDNENETPKKEESLFERFWAEFPRGRRKSKGAARKAWDVARKKTDAQTLIQAAIEYRSSAEGRSEFVKMPSTWLNQECWTDDRLAWKDHKDASADESRRKRRESPEARKLAMEAKRDKIIREGRELQLSDEEIRENLAKAGIDDW